MDDSNSAGTADGNAETGRMLPLSPMARIARALVGAVDVGQVLHEVALGALELTSAEGAYVEQVISSDITVEVVAGAGTGVPRMGTQVPYPGSLTEEMIEGGAPMPLAELERIGPSIAPYLDRSCHGCTALVTPLLHDGDVLGALVVLRQPGGVAFDEEDVQQVRVLGDLASASLRRLLLLQETERERREKTALLESTGEGIYGIDREGRCTFLNPAGARILGYTPEEAMGHNMHALIHGRTSDGRAYPEEACPIFRAISVGTGIRRDDEVFWRRDGSSFPTEYSASPIVDEGAVTGAVVTFVDITERRETERERERLLAAERAARGQAERAVQVRDDVLGVVSHDLRNPLNTVTMAASLLLEMELPEAQERKQLEIIKRAAERMNRLIQDLLDVARIEAGRFAVDRQSLQPGVLVNELCESSRALAQDRSLELHCTAADDLPPILADRDRLMQVLSNLVGNALKFTQPGGRVELRAVSAGEFVRFEVQDTGVGIAAEDLPRLFDAYWQARKTAHMGAGLGLSIAKGIVEAHGGRIGVQSESGAGSTFWFTIPSQP